MAKLRFIDPRKEANRAFCTTRFEHAEACRLSKRLHNDDARQNGMLRKMPFEQRQSRVDIEFGDNVFARNAFHHARQPQKRVAMRQNRHNLIASTRIRYCHGRCSFYLQNQRHKISKCQRARSLTEQIAAKGKAHWPYGHARDLNGKMPARDRRSVGRYCPLYGAIASEPLWPPKPNEFDSATFCL